MITQDKRDKIYNALLIGMALEDAYIYAGLTADEIVQVNEDTKLQAEWHQLIKSFEFSLLSDLQDVIRKQAKMGKEAALTWSLEKMFPRYSGKPQNEGGEVHLHFSNVDPATYDTVEIFNPEATDGQ